MALNAAFWRGRRVFLTGHTGFKGGWLALWLHSLGARVTGYALAPDTEPALFELARVAEGVDSRIGDVRDAPALGAALADSQAEVVLHLAAQPLVRRGYEWPVDTYLTNVMGTVHLLEAVRNSTSVRAVVVATTDKVYADPHAGHPRHESEPLGGQDPYGSSKACAELAVAAYRASFLAERGIAVASARAGNVIGGGDWSSDRLMPDLIRAFARGEAARLRQPGYIRPWQHVLDPLSGYLILAQALFERPAQAASAWNFGPEAADEASVADLARRAAGAWGGNATIVEERAEFPRETPVLRLDSSRARAELGWRPRYRLAGAVQATIDWYRAWRDGADLRALCLQQIAGHAWT